MRRLIPLLFLGLFAVTACAETPRTGTNFCRQLAKEMPGIAVMPATVAEVNAAVGHFTRLQKVAPLEVQEFVVDVPVDVEVPFAFGPPRVLRHHVGCLAMG